MSKKYKTEIFTYIDSEGNKTEVPVNKQRKSSPYKTGEWSMLSHKGVFELLVSSDLPGSAYKLLFYLLTQVDYNNRLFVCKSSMAKDIGWSYAMFHRAFKQLEEASIVWKTKDKMGTYHIYRLNPDIAWKGSTIGANKFRASEEYSENLFNEESSPISEPLVA